MNRFRVALAMMAAGGLACGLAVLGGDSSARAATLQTVDAARLPWVKGATCNAGRLATRQVCTTVVTTTCPWLYATPSCAAFVCGYDCTTSATKNGAAGTATYYTTLAAVNCPTPPWKSCVVGTFGSACACVNTGATAPCGTYNPDAGSSCY